MRANHRRAMCAICPIYTILMQLPDSASSERPCQQVHSGPTPSGAKDAARRPHGEIGEPRVGWAESAQVGGVDRRLEALLVGLARVGRAADDVDLRRLGGQGLLAQDGGG